MKTFALLFSQNQFVRRQLLKPVLASVFLLAFMNAFGQKTGSKLAFTVTMDDPASHLYHVTLQYGGFKNDTLSFKMPVWTPGYYQLMNYAQQVQNFQATDRVIRLHYEFYKVVNPGR